MKKKPSFLARTLKIWTAGVLALIIVAMGSGLAYGDDYNDGLKKAKAEDKAIVLYFYSQYCGYCAAMDKDVLGDKEIAATMRSDLVYVRVDADKRTDLARKYGIRGYPTTALLEPSGKSIIRVPGYLDKKEYRLILDYARKKLYKSTSLRDYLRKSGVAVD